MKNMIFLALLVSTSSAANAQEQMNPREQAAADRLRDSGTMSMPVCREMSTSTPNFTPAGGERTAMVCVETDPARRQVTSQN